MRAARRISARFERLPIRVRLAGVSALLTFVILCAFALTIGWITVHRIRADFNRQVNDTADKLRSQLHISLVAGVARRIAIEPPLSAFASPSEHAVIRIFTIGGRVITQQPAQAPSLGEPKLLPATVHGYRVVSRPVPVRVSGTDELLGEMVVQYGRRVSDTEATVARVELFLLLGVLAGTALALLAGLAIARRAMSPITELTSTAAEIARTRDPSRRVPEPETDDEVAELARTLQGMLRELDAARSETEAMLARQRRFVADASHELRTPLTGVLANLELLADSLHGDQGEAARSALRSSQRMRRLVADLLLLARTDVGRVVSHEPCDLAQVVVEAAVEMWICVPAGVWRRAFSTRLTVRR
jgi:signal transduction histidine kinase